MFLLISSIIFLNFKTSIYFNIFLFKYYTRILSFHITNYFRETLYSKYNCKHLNCMYIFNRTLTANSVWFWSSPGSTGWPGTTRARPSSHQTGNTSPQPPPLSSLKLIWFCNKLVNSKLVLCVYIYLLLSHCFWPVIGPLFYFAVLIGRYK